jgi:hypothetical protein
MKYITVEEYIALRYTKMAPPSKRTIIRMINDGDVPGKKVGRCYYVDVDADILKSNNPLVNRVLGL